MVFPTLWGLYLLFVRFLNCMCQLSRKLNVLTLSNKKRVRRTHFIFPLCKCDLEAELVKTRINTTKLDHDRMECSHLIDTLNKWYNLSNYMTMIAIRKCIFCLKTTTKTVTY